MVIEHIDDKRKRPKHKFLLFGKYVCPECRKELKIDKSPLHLITLQADGCIPNHRYFQTVTYSCSCGYKFEREEENLDANIFYFTGMD